MAKEETNRVFILGAGFSKSAGMPLASELIPLLLDRVGIRDYPELQDWIKDISVRISTLRSGLGGNSETPLNVEELFDFAKHDIELMRMYHQSQTGESPSSAWLDASKSVETWLEYFEEDLLDILLRSQKNSDCTKLTSFVDALRHGDCILTFNYDTLLEQTLQHRNKGWNHGFANEANNGIPILKLHGSIDWWIIHQSIPLGNTEELFEGRFDPENATSNETEKSKNQNRFGLRRARSIENVRALNNIVTDLGCWPKNAPFPIPGLGGLGSYKPLHQLLGSGLVWHSALQAIKKTRDLIVVGWSASDFDRMARFHFASSTRLRTDKFHRIVVIDPDAHNVAARLKPVFGTTWALPECVETVDWSQIGN